MPLSTQVCLCIQSCPTLWDPMNYSPPGSSVHGILQARILEKAVMPSNRWSSQPRDQTQVSPIAGRFLIIWATRQALPTCRKVLNSLTWDIWFSLTLMFWYSYYLVFAAKLLYSGSSSLQESPLELSERFPPRLKNLRKVYRIKQFSTCSLCIFFSWHSLQQLRV